MTTAEPEAYHLAALATGPLHSFSEWPNPDVPAVAFGVYTVWLPDAKLLYVGMSGRGMKVNPDEVKRRGLWTRLNSHASGRRSGDQFCVYVCDRQIVPNLSADQLKAVGEGLLLLDGLTRQYIRDRLSYRFIVTSDSASAYRIERLVQAGVLEAGKPILNPLAAKRSVPDQ